MSMSKQMTMNKADYKAIAFGILQAYGYDDVDTETIRLVAERVGDALSRLDDDFDFTRWIEMCVPESEADPDEFGPEVVR